MTAGTAATDTRARLLDTALKLFSEHGMEGTSLQMIADELGVTKAAVYYHFKTKDEIAESVAAPAIQELDQVIDEARTKRSRGAQIDHALAGFVDVIVRQRTLIGLCNSDPGLQRVINRTWQAPRGEDLRTKMRTVFAGADPSLADTITVHVVITGLAMAGDPWDRARWLAALTALDATAIWEWSVVERVSTGLACTSMDLQPEGRQMLAAADQIALLQDAADRNPLI